ncbi:hypothetical protein FQA39_LY16575 [Lamprigera yunnana]|nr:hypothetical protein FQA39_LY16575 [Lamprigera yunnana]
MERLMEEEADREKSVQKEINYIHEIHLDKSNIDLFGQDVDKAVKDFEDIIDREAKDCYKENNINRAQLDSMLKDGNFPDDRSFKCFFLCVTTHLNVTDDKGNINEQSFRKYAIVDNQKMIDEIYNSCKGKKGTDPCDTVYQEGLCANNISKRYK